MTNILFRCDASPQIGLGHIVRFLALADELHEFHNCHIYFAMRTGPLGIQMVEGKGYKVFVSQECEQSFDYKEWLNECVRNVEAQAIILDVRDGLLRTIVDELRNKGVLIVTIDDPEDKCLSADLAFYPPVPQVKRIDWTGFTGKLYAGWEWVILRKEFAHAANHKSSLLHSPSSAHPALSSKSNAQCPKIPRILVAMGGSDPQSMTIKVMKALEMLEEDFKVVVVLGAGFQHKAELDNLLSGCKHHFDLQEDVTNMAELMSQSDLAVTSFGVTAYELAAMGIPAIYLCLTDDHAESASVFHSHGMGVSSGAHSCLNRDELAKHISQLMNDNFRRAKMRENAFSKIDGLGAKRIANAILQRGLG